MDGKIPTVKHGGGGITLCRGGVLLEKRRWGGGLSRNTEAALQDVRQKVKTWSRLDLQQDNGPKQISKDLTKWIQENKVKVLEWHHKALS